MQINIEDNFHKFKKIKNFISKTGSVSYKIIEKKKIMKGAINMSEMKKIPEEKLNNVSGGCVDDDLLSGHYGENIVCPYCGESSKDMIIYDKTDDLLDPGEYYCKRCKRHFTPTKQNLL